MSIPNLQYVKHIQVQYIQREDNPEYVCSPGPCVSLEQIRLHGDHVKLTWIDQSIGVVLQHYRDHHPQVVGGLVHVAGDEECAGGVRDPVLLVHACNLLCETAGVVVPGEFDDVSRGRVVPELPCVDCLEVSAGLEGPPGLGPCAYLLRVHVAAYRVRVEALERGTCHQVGSQAVTLLTAHLPHHHWTADIVILEQTVSAAAAKQRVRHRIRDPGVGHSLVHNCGKLLVA